MPAGDGLIVELALAGAAPVYLRLLRSQYWSPAELVDLQRRRLSDTLAAALRIPFYAERLPARLAAERLADLPVLRRADIGALLRSVEAGLPPGARPARDRSSGSTGRPAEFLFDRAHQKGRFAARARYLRANGWSPLARSAWIIYLPEGTPDGRLVSSRAVPGARFLSVFTDLDRQIEWLRRLDPVHLYTFPSNLEALLDRIEAGGWSPARLRGVLTGAEVLDETVRRRAERLLRVPVADNYGSTEACLAWQCPAGGYHVNAEHVLIEIAGPDDRPLPPGAMGRVLVTTLENRLMPLVRYEIGDYAVAAAGTCPCGRTLPLLARVAGRAVNLFRARDERLVSPWALVVELKRLPGLIQFQLVQESRSEIRLRFTGPGPDGPRARAAIEQAAIRLLGAGVAVRFEPVAEIARTPGGKYMTAISRLIGAGGAAQGSQ